MTKMDLIDTVAEKTGLTKKDTKKVVDTAIDRIMDYLSREANKSKKDRDKVQIIGFGNFEVRNRTARKGRNPQTGKEITIPDRKVPFFKAGKTFKEQVDK